MISRVVFSTHHKDVFITQEQKVGEHEVVELLPGSNIGGTQKAPVFTGVVRASAGTARVPAKIEDPPLSTSAYPALTLPGFAGGRGGSPNRPPLMGK